MKSCLIPKSENINWHLPMFSQGLPMQINDFSVLVEMGVFCCFDRFWALQHRAHNRLRRYTSSMQPTHFPGNKETEIILTCSQFTTEKKIGWSYILTMVGNLGTCGKQREVLVGSLISGVTPLSPDTGDPLCPWFCICRFSQAQIKNIIDT